MEIWEYAQGLLGATILAEKMTPPIDLIDTCPSSGQHDNWDQPVRPRELRFQQGPQLTIPKGEALANIEARASLLHAFANHELLAIELMALALLKFPDAGKGFRQGLVRAIIDEQRHLQLYQNRLNQFGVTFGDFPVNDFFWNVLSQMKSPLEFLSTMSLTFEQANLDYCAYYAQEFRRFGDEESAGIMETVLKDELAHVAFGLKWFNHWTSPEVPLWQRHQQSLLPPLNLKRAKGKLFRKDLRLRLGFDPNYIEHLENFEHSTGRASNVYVYNPDCEDSLAYAPKAFSPRQMLAQMSDDLDTLPIALAKQDDIILVHKSPSPEFLGQLRKAGFSLPQFIEVSPPHNSGYKQLNKRKIHQLRPWGWSPKIQYLLDRYKICGVSPGGGEHLTLPDLKRIFSKTTSAEWLHEFLEFHPLVKCPLLPLDQSGHSVHDLNELAAKAKDFFESGSQKLVVKAPLSLSGQNFIFLTQPSDIQVHGMRLNNLFRKYGQLVIEPWLNKVFDYSLQIEISPQGALIEKGFARFVTDVKGRYLGALVGGLFHGLPSELIRFVNQTPSSTNDALSKSSTVFREINNAIGKFIADKLYQIGYYGPVGIDQLIYQDLSGNFKIKPLVEINPRYNMGRIVVELSKRVPPGKYGLWNVFSRSDLKHLNLDSFLKLAEVIHSISPPLRLNDRKQIISGPLWLNDPQKAQGFCALLLVGESLSELQEQLISISSSRE